MPDKSPEPFASEKGTPEKAAKGKKKHFKVVQLTNYQGRLVYPAGQNPAVHVSVTPDKDGKTIFDGHKCWKECEAPAKKKTDKK